MLSKFNISIWIFIVILNFSNLKAQNYHAANGSPYFGVSNIYVNPASSINSFYKWDATLLGVQFKTSQNVFQLKNASLLDAGKFGDSILKINEGFATRGYHGVMDVQGFSFRCKLDEKRAFAISLRGRTYNHFKSNNLFYADSIKILESFLKNNLTGKRIDFFATTSSWFETNINYSQIIFQDNDKRFSIGANLGFVKALSGAHFSLNDVQFDKYAVPGTIFYRPTNGTFKYLYSDNLNLFDSAKFSTQLIKDFYKISKNSLALSIGIEYLIVDEDDNNDVSVTNYNWKLGAAILDIGNTKYEYAKGSAINSMPKLSFTDTILTDKFKNTQTFKKFRDSLSTLFYNTDSLQGDFKISLPTRLVLTADKKIANRFFVNASATINFFSTSSITSYNTRELNLFTLTPRYESQLFGAYLPIQYNTQSDLWIGAAVKIGPLLIGVHDLSVLNWFSKKDQTLNAGGYFMLNIYPYKSKKKIDGEIKCPPKY